MNSTGIHSLVARFLSGHGVARCEVSQALDSFNQVTDNRLCVLETTTDVNKTLEYLSLLTWPATRHVAFAASQHATAFINNRRNGSDYADEKIWLASHLKTDFARIVATKRRVWSQGEEREILQYEATIFELYKEDSTLVRSVACLDDGGRWIFEEGGRRHPVENSFPYDARRKRDRFTNEHLRLLTEAFGLPWLTTERFLNAGEYHLLKSCRSPIDSCTIAEADDPARSYYLRGLSWVPHMQSHASSVIADFERCVRINPDYEPKVRKALEAAYRVISNQ